MKDKKAIILSVAVGLLVALALLISPAPVKQAEAQTPDNSLHGYIWSSNIGWISLNSSDPGTGASANQYKVEVINNNLTGYAWSPSLGWLRFGTDLTGPAGGGDNWGAKIDGAKVTGWARFCSVFVSGCSGTLKAETALGGWDGWVKMTDINYTAASGLYAGYAWGNLNLGWTSFSYPTLIEPPPPPGNSEICNGLDDDGDGSVDEGLVCGNGGGGPTVNCSVDPAEGNLNTTFTWTAEPSGFTETTYSYIWGGTLSGDTESITTVGDAVTSGGTVQVTTSSQSSPVSNCPTITVQNCHDDGTSIPSEENPATYCCSPDPGDGEDLVCGPPSACEISINYNDDYGIALNFDANTPRCGNGNTSYRSEVNQKITLSSGCSDVSITPDILPPSINILCSSATGVESWLGCDNLGGGDYWVGVCTDSEPDSSPIIFNLTVPGGSSVQTEASFSGSVIN